MSPFPQAGDLVDQRVTIRGAQAAFFADARETRAHALARTAVDGIGQMRAGGCIEHERIAHGMIALGHQALVQQRATEQHPRQIGRRDGADDDAVTAQRRAENLYFGESARAEHGAQSAHQRTDACADQQRSATDCKINGAAGQCAGRRTRHCELPGRHAEYREAAFGKQIFLKQFDLLLLRRECGMVINVLYGAALLQFALTDACLELFAEAARDPGIIAAFGRRRPFLRRQHGAEQIRDFRRRTPRAGRPIAFQRCDGAFEHRAPLRVSFTEFAESAQHFQASCEVRPLCIEYAHDREVLVQCAPPFLDVIARSDQVDECHARLAGPAQDLHFGFVFHAVGMRAVDDVQDARAVEDRPQQFAFVVESGIALMRGHELAHDRRPRAGAAFVFAQPGERAARSLKARCVDQFVQHLIVDAHAEAACTARRPWIRRDDDRLVFGQRRDDAALALVGVADDRKPRMRIAHVPLSRPLSI